MHLYNAMHQLEEIMFWLYLIIFYFGIIHYNYV